MKGFTLLEIMLAVAVFAVVAVAVHSSFSTTMFSLEQARSILDVSQRGRALVWNLSAELANSLAYDESLFSGVSGGKYDSITFYTTAAYPMAGDKDIFLVSYQASDNNIVKTVNENVFTAAEGIDSFKFSYFDGENWVEEWDSQGAGKLPEAVSIMAGVEDMRFSRTLSLPLGGRILRGPERN